MRIAIANMILGLTTQLFGEWWRRKYQLQTLPNNFHILPLIYGVFSVILRLNTFANFTGFCSLGVALILIGVGRRREAFKPLLYFGIIGVSISAYELLFYQMSLSRAGVNMTYGHCTTGYGNSFGNKEDTTAIKLTRLSKEQFLRSVGRLASLSLSKEINHLTMAILYTGQNAKILTTMG